MQDKNFSLFTESIIEKITKQGIKPSLLLHACCAPCSSYVLEYLNHYFNITLYYYNPNISPEKEYLLRLEELKGFLSKAPFAEGVKLEEAEYEPQRFFEIAKGMEQEKEGGERCKKCYRLRLDKTADFAKKNGFDYFTTTLSISPYKNAGWLNLIGEELAEKYGVDYLFSDFKRKNGYKRSIELSWEYGLYRQDYCGCVYSEAQARSRRLEKNN